MFQIIHNEIVGIFYFFIMFKQNLDSSTKLLKQLAKIDEPLPYRKPEVYSLATLEQVQAGYSGSELDGPNTSYWWEPSR